MNNWVTINRSICSRNISNPMAAGRIAAGKEELMDMRCLEHGKQPDLEEFKKVMQPAVEWMQKNCCPHDKVIIQYDGAELVSGEMAFSVEVPD